MSKDNVFWILVIIVCLLLADKIGWLPQPGEVGQPTAVPQVIMGTAVPAPQLIPGSDTAVAPGMATAIPVETWAGAAPAAVPDLVIISPPATWTAVPPPAQAHSLQDVFLIYGEDAAPCINAIQMNQQLTAVCQTIRADLIRIAAEQGEIRP